MDIMPIRIFITILTLALIAYSFTYIIGKGVSLIIAIIVQRSLDNDKCIRCMYLPSCLKNKKCTSWKREEYKSVEDFKNV